MTDPNERPLAEIQADIEHAREWALRHFNADTERDTLLDPPTFLVEFPTPDEMVVCPKVYGRPLGVPFTYRLAWIGNDLIWVTHNPLTGQRLPGLKVGEAA